MEPRGSLKILGIQNSSALISYFVQSLLLVVIGTKARTARAVEARFRAAQEISLHPFTILRAVRDRVGRHPGFRVDLRQRRRRARAADHAAGTARQAHARTVSGQPHRRVPALPSCPGLGPGRGARSRVSRRRPRGLVQEHGRAARRRRRHLVRRDHGEQAAAAHAHRPRRDQGSLPRGAGARAAAAAERDPDGGPLEGHRGPAGRAGDAAAGSPGDAPQPPGGRPERSHAPRPGPPRTRQGADRHPADHHGRRRDLPAPDDTPPGGPCTSSCRSSRS